MPASAESTAETAPSILLVEEYDALAAAITSALKKFAPDHPTHVVNSLKEAEAATRESSFQLFIIDFDPPHPNMVDFLQRVALSHPAARALVIASGTSPELIRGRFEPNGVQLIEKPFELAEFGAAVQALLGPWTRAGSGTSRGTLSDLGAKDFVPLQCVRGWTGVLRITGKDARLGEVHFANGHICHARASDLEGMAALGSLLQWRGITAREDKLPSDAPRTIDGAWEHVFLDALCEAKRAVEQSDLPPPAPLAPEVSTRSKKIVIIDDTEMLLIFVEDILSTANPELQILTAQTGTEGVSLVRAHAPNLVLLDYSLPDMPGDQVCERLLSNDTTARVPVVMMSGHVPEMMATAKRRPNVVATIAKPFLSDALVTLVKKALAQGPLPATAQPNAPVSGPTDQPTAIVSSAAPSVTTESAAKTGKPITAGKRVKVLVKSSSPPARPTAASALSLAPTSSIELVEPPVAQKSISPGRRPHPAPSASGLRQPTKMPAHPNTVLLGLGLEVISVLFTPRLQVETIRVKPTPTTLSLTQTGAGPILEGHTGSGFELGTLDLDPAGRISTLRMLPMRRPPSSVRPRTGFNINEIKLLNGSSAAIQFTAGMSPPMTLHVTTRVKIAGVELSNRFEVAKLILRPESNSFYATFGPESRGYGIEFETVRVQLDSSARLMELVLRLKSFPEV